MKHLKLPRVITRHPTHAAGLLTILCILREKHQKMWLHNSDILEEYAMGITALGLAELYLRTNLRYQSGKKEALQLYVCSTLSDTYVGVGMSLYDIQSSLKVLLNYFGANVLFIVFAEDSQKEMCFNALLFLVSSTAVST